MAVPVVPGDARDRRSDGCCPGTRPAVSANPATLRSRRMSPRLLFLLNARNSPTWRRARRSPRGLAAPDWMDAQDRGRTYAGPMACRAANHARRAARPRAHRGAGRLTTAGRCACPDVPGDYRARDRRRRPPDSRVVGERPVAAEKSSIRAGRPVRTSAADAVPAVDDANERLVDSGVRPRSSRGCRWRVGESLRRHVSKRELRMASHEFRRT